MLKKPSLFPSQVPMEEEKNQIVLRSPPPHPPDFVLRWGSRKRLRCMKVRGGPPPPSAASPDPPRRVGRRAAKADRPISQNRPGTRFPPERPDLGASRGGSECRESLPSSPEKEEGGRFYYSTRGSEEGNKGSDEGGGGGAGCSVGNRGGLPRFFISLSSKEKEEDFMAMKGCKLPQRPKKRAKCIQKIILLVTPGSWLTDLSQERYEVREKKSSRKRRRGLKAMSMESDSE